MTSFFTLGRTSFYKTHYSIIVRGDEHPIGFNFAKHFGTEGKNWGYGLNFPLLAFDVTQDGPSFAS